MKVGIYDVDSKIPNLALMKISAFHKKRGDEVDMYSPLFIDDYDKIKRNLLGGLITRLFLKQYHGMIIKEM